jgi:hypothetical protein
MKRRHETGIRSESEPTDEVAQQLIANIDASSGSTVVILHNQSGGITAGTVHINALNAAPEPTLQAYEVFTNRRENSEYHSRFMLMVDFGEGSKGSRQ